MEKIIFKPVSLPDDDVIEKILLGDTNLYEVLMRKYNQRLYRIGRSFFRDDDEVEDIMQFAYVRAFEKLSSFEKRSAFSTWLIRIFINEAIARKKYRERFAHESGNEETQGKLIFDKIDMNTPEKLTVNNELKDLLEKAIESLPEKYRLVFVMHELENLSVQETSKCLDLTVSNVKVRLNRARKMLRNYIGSFYRTEEIFSFNLVRCDIIVSKVLGIINSRGFNSIN